MLPSCRPVSMCNFVSPNFSMRLVSMLSQLYRLCKLIVIAFSFTVKTIVSYIDHRCCVSISCLMQVRHHVAAYK